MVLPSFAHLFEDEVHQPFLWESGDRIAILVHGFPGSPAEMRPLAEHLHRSGWTVQGVLLPGFGPQIDSLAEKRQDEWFEAVQEALKSARNQYRQVMLVGHSMGGALSIQAAAGLPPDILILFAPFWHLDHILWRALPVLKYIVPQFKPFKLMKPDFSDPEMRANIGQYMPEADLDDPEVQQAIINFAVPVSMIDQIRVAGQRAYKAADSIISPTLVIQGTQDQLVQPEMTRRFIRRFRAKLEYTEVDADHNLTDSANGAWNALCGAIDTFIATHNTAGANT